MLTRLPTVMAARSSRPVRHQLGHALVEPAELAAVDGDPDQRAACAWLEVPGDLDGAALVAELHAEVTGTPRALPALRGFLDQHLSGTSLEEAARALALSARSLQRKLGEAGTTFKGELAEARVRAACRLLLEGDAPLTAIAYDVGCSSLQHFSAMFRRRVHESPSAFRSRHAAGAITPPGEAAPRRG